jgi:hypothetical protein
MMEGVSAEAASLAGHLKLANLCWIYDNNKITIEGNTELAFSDDIATRFIGHGWNVTRVGDANDLDMLSRALRTFLKTADRPTLIIVDSHIAWGAPHKQDTSAAQGSLWARKRSGSPSATMAGRRTQNFRFPKRFTIISATASADVARSCATPGLNGLKNTGSSIRSWRASFTICSIASCRTAGTAIYHPSQPTRRGLRRAILREKFSTRSPRECPG